jgi:hypothetical protein
MGCNLSKKTAAINIKVTRIIPVPVLSCPRLKQYLIINKFKAIATRYGIPGLLNIKKLPFNKYKKTNRLMPGSIKPPIIPAAILSVLSISLNCNLYIKLPVV